ncbi:fumarylacetoacetate hydrolase family protein [Roseomonas stagni]|uniref:Fumarylacetoacetate hydrolase family protein n=1 Tax=Falsiroseomonas algicola TaxID=2716930 RepID=A0A6M1LNI4_9PROT|nr:fumarylacetoacetate hydrolase family protein [Falsiroseomonas algicola]NGM21602.1 fumarylacetoacetate hydrolase family protein [Falsiroseomonas algicola]
MKICLFDNDRLGVVEGDVVRDVTPVLDWLPAYRGILPRHDPLVAALPDLMPAMRDAARTAPSKPVSAVRFLPPVAKPGKVVAAPVNYRAHLDEAIAEPETFSRAHVRQIQESGLFLKATSSIIGTSDPVRLRHTDRRNDHEIELVAIIGKAGTNITEADALSHVAGYTLGLDMTLRGPEERSFRKSGDSYTVLGPWMVTADEFGDPGDVDVALEVNGEPRQRANTRDLILSVRDLIVFASSFYTLHPGDVLMTGTPEGVGPVRPGDVMRASVGRVATVEVRVEAA